MITFIPKYLSLRSLFYLYYYNTGYRLLGKSQYLKFNLEQLVEQLVEAETLEEQTDILHYLVLSYGLKQKILLPDVRKKT